MKKIAIITYSCAQNWGAILQCYALSNYIISKGYDCSVIDYRKFDSRWFKPRNTAKDIIISLLKYKENKERIEKYKSFRKTYIPLTEHVYTTTENLQKLNNYFDIFICGSDQLWNCQTEICYDFYLDFVSDSKVKIAYAPSFGADQIADRFKKDVARLISRFNKISVREESGKKIINEILDAPVTTVCDPVFLIPEVKWKNLAGERIEPDAYIFVYATEVNNRLDEVVKAYVKMHKGIKVITPYAVPGVKCSVRKNIGPIEFLNYICYADYVIATSFHAAAFSLIFGTKSKIIAHSTTGSRVTDMYNLMGVPERIDNPEKKLVFAGNEDSSYYEKLRTVVKESENYLLEALEEYAND